MVSACELTALVLHNRSLDERRLCQFFVMEDACNYPMAILRNPIQMVRQFQIVLPIAKSYPEMIHGVALFNAPGALVSFIKLFQRIGQRWFATWFPEHFDEAQ